MARRTVLTSRQRSALFALPQREADLLRHYTLSDEDPVRRFVEACRGTRTILPATTTIERLCADALVDAERRIEVRIAERVPPGLRRDLEHLLEETADAGVTRFVWLRQFEPGGNSADGDETAAVRESLRAFAQLGTALIGARDAGEALDAVIAGGPGWEGLGDLVAKAAALASTAVSDPMNHVLRGYSRFRRYTPRTLDIEASPATEPLLEAVDVLRSDGTARPTGFLRPNSAGSDAAMRSARLLRSRVVA